MDGGLDQHREPGPSVDRHIAWRGSFFSLRGTSRPSWADLPSEPDVPISGVVAGAWFRVAFRAVVARSLRDAACRARVMSYYRNRLPNGRASAAARVRHYNVDRLAVRRHPIATLLEIWRRWNERADRCHGYFCKS